MDPHIEARREPDGHWVATMPQFPGWVICAGSRKDALATARELYALLLDEDLCPEGSILASHPEGIPDYPRPELSI